MLFFPLCSEPECLLVYSFLVSAFVFPTISLHYSPLNHLIAAECKAPRPNPDQALNFNICKIQRCLGLGFSVIQQRRRGHLQNWDLAGVMSHSFRWKLRVWCQDVHYYMVLVHPDNALHSELVPRVRPALSTKRVLKGTCKRVNLTCGIRSDRIPGICTIFFQKSPLDS